jgi:hypothetical protein
VPGRIRKLAADAGYDSERVHDLARHDMGVAMRCRPTADRPSNLEHKQWLEVKPMSRTAIWVLAYVAVGLTVVVVDIVAVECSRHRRRQVPPPTRPAVAHDPGSFSRAAPPPPGYDAPDHPIR